MGDQHFPYTYYSCPCTDISADIPILAVSRHVSKEQPVPAGKDEDEQDHDFDPRSPRADLSLMPLEHLLWCTECHEPRCSRCVLEEVVCWYCPTCLFEVPSSTVRSEGNRCTRNCYNCPICTCPLTVNALDNLAPDCKAETPSGPFILMCSWCHWSSLDINVEFEKPNNLTAQLSKIKLSKRSPISAEQASSHKLDQDEIFSHLSAFYRQQLTENMDTPYSASYNAAEAGFSSPNTISRLLNMYSQKKSKRVKPKPMRETLTVEEGLLIVDEEGERGIMRDQALRGLSGSTTRKQRESHPGTSPRFIAELWPVASLLRTKRQKRCKHCRTLLVRPEARMTNTRWRIRLLALNHLPKISLRALSVPATIGPQLLPAAPGSSFDYDSLQPGRTYQFLLTAYNPLFDMVNVTLATATTTPGRVKSKITILCPQFTIGANSDVWDEALGPTSKRRSVMPGSMQQPAMEEDSSKQAEAGQVWRKGRNWASVIVEIVPGFLPETTDRKADEDLLEVAIFVHAEYETTATAEEKQVGATTAKEKREAAFWVVVGAGRITSV